MYRQLERATPSGQRVAVAQRRRRGTRFGIGHRYPPTRRRKQPPIRHNLLVPRNASRPHPPSSYLYLASLGSICLCVVLWVRAKTIGEDERGNAERRALFVGLWPPMFWLIADAVHRAELRQARARGFWSKISG